MRWIHRTSQSYWPIAFVLGTLINSGLFVLLPQLGYSQATPPPPTIITVELGQWHPAVQPEAAKTAAPKTAPPKPVVAKPLLQPEPTQQTAANPSQPVLTESEVEPVATTSTAQAPAPQEQVLPPIVPLFMLTSMPRTLHAVNPEYPPEMRNQGKTGKGTLKMLIDQTGRVLRVTVVDSAGEQFDKSAIASAMQSTFEPARQNGQPVATELVVPFSFELR